jgi:chromate reductase, NAD(P)H dehydrogenase (quinone)
MITIISGTNRVDSFTETVAMHYASELAQLGAACQVLSLRQLPVNIVFSDVYGQRTPEMQAIIDQYIEPIHKFVFVVPEYNGSFPGVLKIFLDAVSPKLWKDKKSAMIGVSSGLAGNLRGQEHLTGILHYLKMNVHYSKPKLSGVDKLFSPERQLIHEPTRLILNEHAQAVVSF